MGLLQEVQKIRIKDYDYGLPDERIAKYPAVPRNSSKLLIYDGEKPSQDVFSRLVHYLPSPALMVFNNTRVIHARLLFHKISGAGIEIFCLEPAQALDYVQSFQSTSSCEWLCIIGNSKKWKEGSLVKELCAGTLQVQLQATRLGQAGLLQRVRFEWHCPQRIVHFAEVLEMAGLIPIPPYLKRESENSDTKDYQTVYSKIKGSVAAPTAGLHFSQAELEELDRQDILRRELTLHVSASTFQPVKSVHLDAHPMHSEFISVERRLIEEILLNKHPLIAVGTTSVRTLESLYWFGVQLMENPLNTSDDLILDQWFPYLDHANHSTESSLRALLDYLDRNNLEHFCASTRLLIVPGYRFRLVNVMLTNFHQAQSTLLLLVAAFVGEDWKRIYRYALEQDFRFLSYGDSSLLFPGQPASTDK